MPRFRPLQSFSRREGLQVKVRGIPVHQTRSLKQLVEYVAILVVYLVGLGTWHVIFSLSKRTILNDSIWIVFSSDLALLRLVFK